MVVFRLVAELLLNFVLEFFDLNLRFADIGVGVVELVDLPLVV